MSLDLNLLSIAQLKAELKQKGLETTGKKTDLVTRLKTAIEAGHGAENEDEIEEDVKEDETQTDGEEKTTDRKKSKKWLHILGTRKYNSKIRHLECVQKMSQKRKRKDFLTGTNELRVRVYPITLEDLQNPTIVNIMQQCSSSAINFYPSPNEDGEKELMGMLQLTFARKCDMADSIATLLLFKDGVNVHHATSSTKYNDYVEEWRQRHTGSSDPSDHTLMICPLIPDEVSEEQLWHLFSRASEIHIIDKHKATVMYAGKEEEQDQPRFAYVQYPNEAVWRMNMEEIQEVQPTAEMRKLCLIPFLKLVDEEKKEDKKEEKVKTTNVKSSPQKNSTSTAQKSKKGPGVVSTVKGMPNQRSQASHAGRLSTKARAVSHQNQRSMYASLQQRPASAPHGLMGRLQAEAAMRGPEEAQGIRMLGNMLNKIDQSNSYNRGWQEQNRGWQEQNRGWQDQSNQHGGWQDDDQWAGPSVQQGGPRQKRRRQTAGYSGYDESRPYQQDESFDGLMSKIVSVTRQLNEVGIKGNDMGPNTVGGIGRGVGRGMARGRGIPPPGVGYRGVNMAYGGDGYGKVVGHNQRY